MAPATAALSILAALAPHAGGLNVDGLLGAIGQTPITKAQLRETLDRLDADGFVSLQRDDQDELCAASFRNLLLRRWWLRYPPHETA